MIARNAIALLLVLVVCIAVYPQGTNCSPGQVSIAGISGTGDTGGPTCCGPSSPAWNSYVQLIENQDQTLLTCTYVYYPPGPGGDPSGYFWIGNCVGRLSSCLSGKPLPPPNSGSESPSKCPNCGAPISLMTGNTFIEESDIRLPGLGGGLALARTWNSAWPNSEGVMSLGLFGDNWKSTYEERLFLASDGTLKYARSSGDFWSFESYSVNGGSIGYKVVAPANQNATVTIGAGFWTMLFPSGETRVFDPLTGLLLDIIDRNGNETQLMYDGANRLTTVTDAASRHLYFSYPGPSSYLVTGVSSDVGLSLTYAYDAQNRLSQVTKPDLTTINFTYNAQSLITSVTDSQGKVLESHTYDSSGRGLTSSRANGVESVTVTYPQ